MSFKEYVPDPDENLTLKQVEAIDRSRAARNEIARKKRIRLPITEQPTLKPKVKKYYSARSLETIRASNNELLLAVEKLSEPETMTYIWRTLKKTSDANVRAFNRLMKSGQIIKLRRKNTNYVGGVFIANHRPYDAKKYEVWSND